MSTSIIQRNLSWKKQKSDSRDFNIHNLEKIRRLISPPSSANLRRWCSEVEDQGNLGSCTANAWAGLLKYDENKYPVRGRIYFNMSRLFIYYNERVIGNTVNQDSGAELRDGAKVLNQYGCCAEYDWPYIENQFVTKPTDSCFKVALPNAIHSYYSLGGNTPAETLTNLKTCLASGQPFVFGFQVYDSFMTNEVATTGVMPMPNLKTEQVQGGHAVMAVGYNDKEQRILVRNSWGKGWGLPTSLYNGYFTMPYDFISDANMASDFWTVVKDV